VDGVTSAIQTQIDGKQATITGAATTIDDADLTASRAVISNASGKVAVSGVTTTELDILDGLTASTAELNIMDGVTATTVELNIMDGVTATTAEINYVDGVTSAIQTQIDGKQATITGAATTIDDANLTASRAVISNASGKVAVSAVTDTELGYLDGVTSAVQTQIDGKQATITGAASSITSSNLTALRSLYSDASGKVAASSITATELSYLGGVTSAIQTQIDSKQATITGAATTIDDADLTASRAVISNASGKVAVSAVTSTEVGYLDGVTSAIQTQIDGKAANTTLAESTWETGTSTTETIVSPAKVKAAIDANSTGLGVNQTWQNMTSSRGYNTTFQNTTGRPICVNVTGQPATGSTMILDVSSNSNMSSSIQLGGQKDVNGQTTISAIIPNNQYYKLSVNNASLTTWAELR